MILTTDPITLSTITLAFLVAGFVKGTVGFGLPSVSLALLTTTVGLQPAIALLLVPTIGTNAWQALVGGNGGAIIRRIWPFLVFATTMTWVGAQALTRVDMSILSALLGSILVIYAAVGLSHPQLSIPREWEIWAGPLAGIVNGVLTGMTGSAVVPGALYLQAIGLGRNVLVQAMGILFTAATVGLAISLGHQQILTAQLGVLSAAAVIPAVFGMSVGYRLRQKLPEAKFRQLFLIVLSLLGSYIIVSALA